MCKHPNPLFCSLIWVTDRFLDTLTSDVRERGGGGVSCLVRPQKQHLCKSRRHCVKLTSHRIFFQNLCCSFLKLRMGLVGFILNPNSMSLILTWYIIFVIDITWCLLWHFYSFKCPTLGFMSDQKLVGCKEMGEEVFKSIEQKIPASVWFYYWCSDQMVSLKTILASIEDTKLNSIWRQC